MLVLRMGLLKIAGPDLSRRDLRGYSEHRDSGSVAIKKAVDQMQVARSATACTDRERARQVRLCTRRKGGNLLVPDMHPLDLALAANGIGDAVEAVADNAVNTLDARCCEDFRKLISYGFCHL